MKKLVTALCLFLLSSASIAADANIKEIEFNDSNLIDVVRTLSELSDSNIIATPSATEKKVTIRLKDVTVVEALKSISRISDLWYRYDDDTDTYRLMTREEYSRDLIVRESEHIQVFSVLNANVRIIAQAIQDLYGQRVVLSLGEPVAGGSPVGGNIGGGSNNRGRQGSRGNRNNNAGGSRGGGAAAANANQFDPDEITQKQLEDIAERLQNTSSVTQQTIQDLSGQAQPIYITVNNEHNMIIVRTDDKKIIASIDSLIKKMDIAVPQVMLEMKILSITLGDDFNSIFNFSIAPSGENRSTVPAELGNNILPGNGTFIYEFLNSRLQANIEFLEENQRVKVLSNPMVLASNHRQAELFIGEEAILTRGFTYNPAIIDNGIVISQPFIETETETQEVGITLSITPRINSDETVTLQLEQESSTLNIGGGILPIAAGDGAVFDFPIDTIDTARLRGTVVARDNLTVAVGGLIRSTIRNTERKVPFLGEIPIIGRVFRSTTEAEEDTEMVLLITPRILNKPSDSETIRKTDNRFYQDVNRGYPDIAPVPNKYIEKTNLSPADPVDSKTKRQQLYMDMTQYAADTIRIPEIERVKHNDYQALKVNKQLVNLFNNKHVNTKPIASWQRGGLHITAIEVSNNSSQLQDLDYRKINGKWLASSIENNQLSANGQGDDRTYLYLISALSFAESLRK